MTATVLDLQFSQGTRRTERWEKKEGNKTSATGWQARHLKNTNTCRPCREPRHTCRGGLSRMSPFLHPVTNNDKSGDVDVKTTSHRGKSFAQLLNDNSFGWVHVPWLTRDCNWRMRTMLFKRTQRFLTIAVGRQAKDTRMKTEDSKWG